MWSRAPLLAALVTIPVVSAQLNALAKAAGKLYFGTATDNGELNNTEYFKILTDTREFGQITPANTMKWDTVEPEPNTFHFAPGTVISNLATSHHDVLRCHNLVWHQQLPSWVTSSVWSKENLTAALKLHVFTEARHWSSVCYAWDVVNEALNDNGTLQSNIFYDTLGQDYIKIAFETAALADPKAKLYYNDFNIEFPGPKATAAQELVKWLKGEGVRIDGVGLQSHFIVGETPKIDDQIANMEAFTKLGVDVAVTELDVRLNLPDTEEQLVQQSKDYETTVGACVQVERCVGVTVWDFYDPFSWVPSTFPGQGDADLYFANFTKHPAYQGVVDALKNATKPRGPHYRY